MESSTEYTNVREGATTICQQMLVRIETVALGFWGAATLLSADELGIFSALANGPLDATSLIARLELRPEVAWDFFDALVALKLLEQLDGLYANAPHVATYLDRASPSYLGNWLAMARCGMREMVTLTARLRSLSTANRQLPIYLHDSYEGTTVIRAESRVDLTTLFPAIIAS